MYIYIYIFSSVHLDTAAAAVDTEGNA